MKAAERGPLLGTGLLAAIASVAIVLGLSACGSGQDSEAGRAAAPESASSDGGEGDRVIQDEAAGHPANSSDAAGAQSRRGDGPAPRGQSSKQGAAGGTGSSGSATPAEEATAGIDRSAGSCPRSLTRAQCLANARASQQQPPSYVVTEPRDCLDAMSRADCEALIERERAAQEGSGPSFNPDECLRYYTREECEAVFEAMGQSPK